MNLKGCDWVVFKNKHQSIYQVEKIEDGYYILRHTHGGTFRVCVLHDESLRLWTIQDAEAGDVLASKDELSILIFRNLDTSTSFSSYYNIQRKGELGWSNECFIPATKEQRDQLEKTMADAGYTFDFEKKATSSCQEHCKGFQETEKCFADGDCKAKTAYKDEPKEDNRPVTERIKTFDDALEVLGDEHPLVKEYWGVVNVDLDITQDLIAYLKLRIIVAALNDGWEPKFEKGEYRFFPWFYFYNKEQYDELDVEKKERCVLRSGGNTSSYYGFVGCSANNDASGSNTGHGSRLVFRTRQLAAYAGRQFIDEWADFVFKTE